MTTHDSRHRAIIVAVAVSVVLLLGMSLLSAAAVGQQPGDTRDLAMTMSADSTNISPGDPVTVNISLANSGSQSSPAPVFDMETLPPEWDLKSWSTPNASYRANTTEWLWTELPGGQNESLTLTVESSENATGFSFSGQVTDGYDNTVTAETDIEFNNSSDPSQPDDDNDNTGGGGGGGGGAGGAGGGGGSPSGDEGPPSVADVRSTLNLVSPSGSDDVQTTGSSTVTPSGSDTVSEIAFNADSVDTTVTVSEYGQPPSTVAEDVIASAQSDGVEISSEDDVVSLTTIETGLSAREDSSATVRLTIDQEYVDDPANLVVVKETYSASQQRDRWVQRPTSIVDTSGGMVTVETTVDSFSMVAVVEQNGSADTAGPGEVSNTTSNGSETDDSAALPILVPLVALLLTAGLLTRYEKLRG